MAARRLGRVCSSWYCHHQGERDFRMTGPLSERHDVLMDVVKGDYDKRRREELGAFLRTRRAQIRPEDVDLAPGPRRRTPGLRREEVAQLAGVGVTWYTWLEQ